MFITITRPGKTAKHVEAVAGQTLEQVLQLAEIPASEYTSWTFTHENGSGLMLSSILSQSAAIVCGGRVAGA